MSNQNIVISNETGNVVSEESTQDNVESTDFNANESNTALILQAALNVTDTEQKFVGALANLFELLKCLDKDSLTLAITDIKRDHKNRDLRLAQSLKNLFYSFNQAIEHDIEYSKCGSQSELNKKSKEARAKVNEVANAIKDTLAPLLDSIKTDLDKLDARLRAEYISKLNAMHNDMLADLNESATATQQPAGTRTI